ncbi:MAG TPA: hypothetical protein PKJ05_05415 [Bacillota bacterium]|nr:hypothetical protein [Bacillota bacterium]HOA15752.1 hypothetical protein [Bacillota bacterium]
MPQDTRPSEIDPNFMGGLPEGAEIVLLIDGSKVIKTDVSWFDSYLDGEIPADGQVKFNFRILGSKGWTEVQEVARRAFWEHESIVTLSVRKGKSRLACGTVVPVIRGGKQLAVEVENLAAGDTLSFHDYMMLRSGQNEPKGQVIVRGQGLMEKKKNPAEGAKLYFIRTASGDIIADGIVVLTGRQG